MAESPYQGNVFDSCGALSCRCVDGSISIQVTVRVATRYVEAILKASGVDSVFARPFFEEDEDKDRFKIVPCRLDVDLASALRQAGRTTEHYGVVKTYKGFGIRVLAGKYEEAARLLRPEDADSLTGTKYEVTGLPLYCGRDAIEELLVSWPGAVPITTFRTSRTRTWIVSAPSPLCRAKFNTQTASSTSSQRGRCLAAESSSHHASFRARLLAGLRLGRNHGQEWFVGVLRRPRLQLLRLHLHHQPLRPHPHRH